MAFVSNTDLVPRLADYTGLDATIESLSYQELPQGEFLTALYNAMGGAETGAIRLTWDIFKQMLADLQNDSRCQSVVLRGDEGDLPSAVVRPVAPAGIGHDAAAIWFSTPTEVDGVSLVYCRWYKNGALVARVEQDISTNRSILRGTGDGQMNVSTGDIVQAAIEKPGTPSIVGWWGRVEIDDS